MRKCAENMLKKYVNAEENYEKIRKCAENARNNVRKCVKICGKCVETSLKMCGTICGKCGKCAENLRKYVNATGNAMLLGNEVDNTR